MKVFISWSGERSQALAQALRDWLPLVLHYVEPWLSEADVAAGDRWAQEVAKELEASNFGVICVTPENVGSPWVLFEAGALAKSMQGSRVIPLLFNLEFSDITGPLAQFQAKKVEKSGLGEVVQSLNQATGKETDQTIPEDRAKQLFIALWPEFEKQLESIPGEAPTERHMRPQQEILEELVAGVRGLDSRFRELESAVSEDAPRSRRGRLRHLDPMMLEQMLHMLPHEVDDPVALLIFAGLLRDDFPWLYEIVMEAYHDLRRGGPRSALRTMERLRQVTRAVARGPLMEMVGASSKDEHMMLMELPMMLDHFLQRYEGRRQRSASEEPAQEVEDRDE